MGQCGNNNVPFRFYVASGKSLGSCGKSGIMCMKTFNGANPPEPKKLSVSNISFFFFFFSRSEGRGPVFLAVICLTSGSVTGQCQVEQRSRIPPAYPELNATPSLHQACHEQSR